MCVSLCVSVCACIYVSERHTVIFFGIMTALSSSILWSTAATTPTTTTTTTNAANTPAPPSSLVYDQEIVEPHVALERAQISLREWEEQVRCAMMRMTAAEQHEQLPPLLKTTSTVKEGGEGESDDDGGGDAEETATTSNKRRRISIPNKEEKSNRLFTTTATTSTSTTTRRTITNGCCCRHIQEYLPLELPLQFGVRNMTSCSSATANNTCTASTSLASGGGGGSTHSTTATSKTTTPSNPLSATTSVQPPYALWLSHPIHALHLSSQGLCELTKSVAAQQQQQQQAAAAAAHKKTFSSSAPSSPTPQPTPLAATVTQPLLYGEEHERTMALQVSGLPELWHPVIDHNQSPTTLPQPTSSQPPQSKTPTSESSSIQQKQSTTDQDKADLSSSLTGRVTEASRVTSTTTTKAQVTEKDKKDTLSTATSSTSTSSTADKKEDNDKWSNDGNEKNTTVSSEEQQPESSAEHKREDPKTKDYNVEKGDDKGKDIKTTKSETAETSTFSDSIKEESTSQGKQNDKEEEDENKSNNTTPTTTTGSEAPKEERTATTTQDVEQEQDGNEKSNSSGAAEEKDDKAKNDDMHKNNKEGEEKTLKVSSGIKLASDDSKETEPQTDKDSEKKDETDQGAAAATGAASLKTKGGSTVEQAGPRGNESTTAMSTENANDPSDQNGNQTSRTNKSGNTGNTPIQLLSKDTFQRYQTREENVRAVRRALLGKRYHPGAAGAKQQQQQQQQMMATTTPNLLRSSSQTLGGAVPTTSSSSLITKPSAIATEKRIKKKTVTPKSVKSSATTKTTGVEPTGTTKKKKKKSIGGAAAARSKSTASSASSSSSTSKAMGTQSGKLLQPWQLSLLPNQQQQGPTPPQHLTQLVSYQMPLIETQVASTIVQTHQQVQERTKRQVERWMTHYRLAATAASGINKATERRTKRLEWWRRNTVKSLREEQATQKQPEMSKHGSNKSSANRKRITTPPLLDKTFVFGAMEDDEEDDDEKREGCNDKGMAKEGGKGEGRGDPEMWNVCEPCHGEASIWTKGNSDDGGDGPLLLYCLDCGYMERRTQMRHHMVLQQHWLAVTVPPKLTTTAIRSTSTSPWYTNTSSWQQKQPKRRSRQLYCFHCDDYFQHVVFLQEEERLVLQELIPSMAWTVEQVGGVQRSFDPLRFMRIPDVGIFWNGFHATYPLPVPQHHIQASRVCRLRRQLVERPETMLLLEEEREELSYPRLPVGAIPNNSRNRNRGLMRELVSVVQEKICKPVGMYNLGHTCFQSAVFQCLVHCQALQVFFLHDVGHASGACQLYRNAQKSQQHHAPQAKMRDSSVCLACEMDRLFLHYQSKSSGVNVFKAMQDLVHQSSRASAATVDLVFDPLAVLRNTDDGADGAVVERVIQGEPLMAQKDLLTATWNCKQMAHLAGYDQRDAHEFLHAFLETLGQHTQNFSTLVSNSLLFNKKRKKNEADKQQKTENATAPQRNVIQDMFEGTLRSVLLCQECGGKRVQKESFLSISLDLSKEVQKTASVAATAGAQFIPPRSAPPGSGNGVGSSSKPALSSLLSLGVETRKLSVEKCLHYFTAPEELVDPVDCPMCMRKTTTKKQLVISRLPPVVCLHLKRFQGATGRKLEAFVSFPARDLNLGMYLPHWCEDSGSLPTPAASDIGQQQTQPPQPEAEAVPPQVPYNLFATVNHFGNLQSGHYVAYVKIDDQWYHCNDSHVSYATEAHVLQQGNAYLLFYAREESSSSSS